MKHFRTLTPLLLLCFSSVLFAQITPLPTSGPISLGEIGAYFENTAPHSLSEFYRGGSEVQNTSHNNGIPTSGAISLGDFHTTYSIPNCTLSITNESSPVESARAIFSFERWGEMGSLSANIAGNNLISDTCGCTGAHTPRPDSCSSANTCSCQGSPGWIT